MISAIKDPAPADFPKYLLNAEHPQIRNRKLTPEETAKLVKELWKAKLAARAKGKDLKYILK